MRRRPAVDRPWTARLGPLAMRSGRALAPDRGQQTGQPAQRWARQRTADGLPPIRGSTPPLTLLHPHEAATDHEPALDGPGDRFFGLRLSAQGDYPVLLIDAIVVKIRDGQVANRPVYVAMGVNLDGERDVLGMWVGPAGGEGAKFWTTVLTELRNRGVTDTFVVCCDGLKGLPDAIRATWPLAEVQLCVVHLVSAPTCVTRRRGTGGRCVGAPSGGLERRRAVGTADPLSREPAERFSVDLRPASALQSDSTRGNATVSTGRSPNSTAPSNNFRWMWHWILPPLATSLRARYPT